MTIIVVIEIATDIMIDNMVTEIGTTKTGIMTEVIVVDTTIANRFIT
jgi:hypothetical protein